MKVNDKISLTCKSQNFSSGRFNLSFCFLRKMKLFKCFVFFFTISAVLHANVKMPAIFGNNMVLQRDIPLNVWGWASPGEKVTVTFAGQNVSVTADKDGSWIVKLNPVKLNKLPENMTVSGKNKLTFKNILVGDVWICSGQSNMEMMVASTLNAKKEISSSDNPLIRQIKISHKSSLYPKNNLVSSKWVAASPKTTIWFTAAGYYFAREIVKETGVPIGLINTSWGGTRIEPWIAAEGFKRIPELEKLSTQVDLWLPASKEGKNNFLKYFEDMKLWLPNAEAAVRKGKIPAKMPIIPGGNNTYQSPTMIFNAMVNPIVKYGIRGVLWYQGEANGGEGEIYIHKMKALISNWRTLWKQGNFPFYFVQLASFLTSNPNNPAGDDGWGWAKLREAQLKTLLVVPNTGMSVTIDIGEAKNIHPKDKQDVGKRLAAWALKNDYNKNVVVSGPLFKNYKIEENKIVISFDHTGSGLTAGIKNGIAPFKETPKAKLKWFAIAGADKKWYWADAVINGNQVVVSSDKVKNPVAVRYAFAMNPQGANLYNKEGFPASPFRTD